MLEKTSLVVDPLSRPDDWIGLTFEPEKTLHLKIEGLNASGSIKHKTAASLVVDAIRAGLLKEGARIIESSSGSLGCALSSISARLALEFTCVTDPNASPDALQFMRSCGAEVVVVRDKDDAGGYLGTRLAFIHARLKEDNNLVWLNQYRNQANSDAHASRTGPEIIATFQHLDVLYLGAGTTGTLMGCTSHFATLPKSPRIVAVDTEGSSTFGYTSSSRRIPGLGTSVTPEILNRSAVKYLSIISEVSAVAVCRAIARQTGILLGGSSGSIIAAYLQDLQRIPASAVVAAVSPDMGDRYLRTIYDDEWVGLHFDLREVRARQEAIKVSCLAKQRSLSDKIRVFNV